jgi:hypothetical protein
VPPRRWGREKLGSLMVVLANVPLAPWMEGTLKRFAAAELGRGQSAPPPEEEEEEERLVSRAALKGADLLEELGSLLELLKRATAATRSASTAERERRTTGGSSGGSERDGELPE